LENKVPVYEVRGKTMFDLLTKTYDTYIMYFDSVTGLRVSGALLRLVHGLDHKVLRRLFGQNRENNGEEEARKPMESMHL
jgi:hypothetical protein